MTLTELRYITAVARERHFGRAAEACFVSQPTLSVAVRKLEDELGVKLFERNAAEVTVTPAGERIVAQALRVLEETEVIKQIAEQGKDQLVGPLRLGAINTIGPYLYPDLIPNLHELAPDMPLFVEEDFTTVLTDKLKQGQLDVIIISPPYEEPGVLTLPLYEEPFVVLLPSAHPLSKHKKIEQKLLMDESLLLLGSGNCFRDQVIRACPDCAPGDAGEHLLQHTLEGSSLETIRHMVASGMGITVLPCTAAGADRYSQRLLAIRRFPDPAPSRRVALAWRKTFPRPRVIEVLKQAVARCNLSCTTLLGNEEPE
jgi:LysR family hydrogen peroxide-inducible transcriptional activator